MPDFNKRLRSLRTEKGLSQQELANQTRVSKSSINMYERGEREPGFETLETFADYFNVNMDYLLGKSDVKRMAMPIEPPRKRPHRKPVQMKIGHPAKRSRMSDEKRKLIGLAATLPEDKAEMVLRIIKSIVEDEK